MAIFSDPGKTHPLTNRELAVIVEARDIPILSSTDRLQRALLRWVDLCGLSGQFISESDVIESLSGHDCLDEKSYVIEINGENPNQWTILWTGERVSFSAYNDFREALLESIPDDRFADLLQKEYFEAVRYRRASARRFARRNQASSDTMDQLIFPLRDSGRSEFVLVVGEAVTGRSVYGPKDPTTSRHGDVK